MRYILASLMLGLSGCAPAPDPTPVVNRFDREIALCREALKARLIDPESAQFSGERLDAEYPDERVYALEMNAKNRFGGYVGRETMACVVSAQTGRVLRVL